jgi:enamine deaminase RidA (YjgF/YER057c/UK114 family)
VPDVEARLAQLGLELPAVRPPAGTFAHAVRTGSLLFLGGHLPWRADGTLVQGKLGADLDAEAGYEAARLAALSALATMRDQPGGLDAIQRLVKVYGVVNATPDFMLHTQVINGASDLFVQVFGEAGQHVRLAVGVSSLPFNLALEIELVAEIAD